MPRSQQARFSFSDGVLSPRLTMRVDSDKYNTACKLIQNFIVTPQGGALFREGLKDIGRPFDPSNPFRVFSFRDGGDRSDAIFEVGPGTTRFWRDDVLIPNPTVFDLSVSNPFLLSDLDALHFTNQETLTVITSDRHPPQLLSLSAATTLTELPLEFDEIPSMSFFDYKSPRLSNDSVTYDVSFSNDWNDNDQFTFQYGGIVNSIGYYYRYYQSVNKTYRYQTNDALMETVLETCFKQAFALRAATVVATSQGGNRWEVAVTSNAAGRTALFDFLGIENKVASAEVLVGNVNTGTEPAWSYAYVVENNAVFYECLLPHTSTALNEPGVGADWADFWVVLAGEPDWWDYQHGGSNDWVISKIYAPWGRGFPRVAEFHQQRLFLAGSRDAPTTIWASRIGTYNDFRAGANDTDPIEFALDTSDTPEIKWMSSTALGLLMGTSAGEFIMSAQVSLSPSDIQAQRQNYSRAAPQRAIKINNVVFYIELGDTKLRASQFSRDLQGYESIDASILSENLLRKPGLKNLAMIRTPESVMFLLRHDGSIVMMTYEGAQGSSAWSESTFTDNISDINSVYSSIDKEDAIYVCAERQDGWHLEKMVYPRRTFGVSSLGSVHLDSFEEGDLAAGQTQITGLERFAATSVFLTVNDAVVGSRAVDVSGVMLIDYPALDGDRYALGYLYEGRIVTFEHVEGNPRGIGFGTARNWNKLFVRLLDSGLPKINGLLPPDRTPASLMDLPEPLRSFDARVANIGYGDGSIDILQDLPFPTHILGVYGEFVTYNV